MFFGKQIGCKKMTGKRRFYARHTEFAIISGVFMIKIGNKKESNSRLESFQLPQKASNLLKLFPQPLRVPIMEYNKLENNVNTTCLHCSDPACIISLF
jgi:hypothetical protein